MRKGFKVDEISDEGVMRARAGYFACVSYLDEIIGDFLIRFEKARLSENTIIIYTSDHGEMAGEHGVWWKQGWYEACTRVPLLISLPEHRRGELPGSVLQVPVGLVDLFPTICSFAGAQHPQGLDGVDLSQSIIGESAPPDRPVFCDNLMPRWGDGTEFRMIRQGKYKYVRFRNAPPLLFDLAEDPDEQVNLCQNLSDSIRLVWEEFEKIAKKTMDFDEAEKERLERDACLADVFQLNVPESTGNLYLMPSGKLVNAEDLLYNPTVILERPEEIFVKKSG
jgi:choline-sulfatase